MFDKHYTLEDIVRMDTELQMNRSINKYGLEGAEEKIKETYKYSEGLMNYLLGILYEFWQKKIGNKKGGEKR